MKTIEVRDEDYDILMELSKELQTQTNNGQAFPYFWEPSSLRMEMNPHGEGRDVRVYHDTELYGFLDFAEMDDYESYNKFLKDKMEYSYDMEDETEELPYTYGEYYPEIEDEWKDYIEDYIDDTEVYTFDWNQKQEHNPSLFKSDADKFVQQNSHHLGRDPHTYSRTIFRMPKMEKLVECLLRFNNNVPEACVNHEALRFKNKGKK